MIIPVVSDDIIYFPSSNLKLTKRYELRHVKSEEDT